MATLDRVIVVFSGLPPMVQTLIISTERSNATMEVKRNGSQPSGKRSMK